MFSSLFSLSRSRNSKRSVTKGPQRRRRQLCGESLERREVFSGSGFSLSAAGEAAIVNDGKALHLPAAEVSALALVDAIAKVENINVTPTAIANTRGLTAAEKVELWVINENLNYSRPVQSFPVLSAQAYTPAASINLAFQTPTEVDAWLNSDASDLYAQPDDISLD